MDQNERRIRLIRFLIAESPEYSDLVIPEDESGAKRLLRGLMNLRPPLPAPDEFLRIQDAYLAEELRKKGVVHTKNLDPVEPGISLWQGDITRLDTDAIVNAANSGLTGCYRPCHGCIDNAIHTYAGVELRLACAKLAKEIGHPETPGLARATPAFNLPSRYVLHTVGPIVEGPVTDEHRTLLRSCYESCLELTDRMGLGSVAFCCISTGVFGFPQEPAAEIAVGTVRDFLPKAKNVRQVVFNVFKDSDHAIYERLLKEE